jgi:hypothetical protein
MSAGSKHIFPETTSHGFFSCDLHPHMLFELPVTSGLGAGIVLRRLIVKSWYPVRHGGAWWLQKSCTCRDSRV